MAYPKDETSKGRPPSKAEGIRLNKFLADCGITSRRKADELIEQGHVQVNGKTVYELGVRVTPDQDRVTVDGKPVRPANQKIYVAFYKPENVLTTMDDPEGRPTVADFMEQLPVRVFPVGRLDWDTEGLLLLTNDGDFAQKVMHPREEIPKTYLAKLDGKPTDQQLQKLTSGVTIPGGRVKAWHVERAKIGDSKQYEWIKIVIGEGKNRQIKYMFQKIGFDVKKLKRVAIGLLTLGPLEKGEYAFLDKGALAKIFRQRKEPKLIRKTQRARGASPRANTRPRKVLGDWNDVGHEMETTAADYRSLFRTHFNPPHPDGGFAMSFSSFGSYLNLAELEYLWVWTAALGGSFFLAIAAKMILTTIGSRLRTLAARTPGLFDDIAADFFFSTRRWFLFAVFSISHRRPSGSQSMWRRWYAAS
ncbi:MAG: rRNA pseudouridine synthase [Calothrix sp. SM1_5_4]|nr:rRNA pseudouridine synthase [Calothrix sp. SM1_5_4]